MSNYAIRVQGLGKQYTIGAYQGRYKSLRDSLMRSFTEPLRRIGRNNGADKADRTIWALKDVSFDIEHGEVVGIIGRNGAGKSTLLKLLARITEPTEGEIRMRGRVGSLLEVGTGFHPELTGRENIFLNGAILGMSRVEIQRKFDEIVDFAEIEKFIDTPAKHYSSGMYMRLAFAVAAHLEPEILLVDEVLAVGDAQFQKKCLGKMGDVAREGRTVLFVSHNMAAVEGLCKKLFLLKDGSIEYSGEVRGGIARYLQIINVNADRPINERLDRFGSGKVKVVDIKFFDDKGFLTNSINMGSSFSIEMKLVGSSRSAVIGVLIGNQVRSQIIRAYTWENLSENVILEGTTYIKCSFNKFPLIHGSYSVGIWIAERNGSVNEMLDHVENAATLNVKPVDVYGNGRLLDPGGYVAFCLNTWEFVQEEENES